MNNKFLCLRNIQLYDDVSEDELKAISTKAVASYFDQGIVLYSPENPAQHVYLLKEGEVELYQEENGKRVVLETLFPGDVFGDFGAERTTHSAITTRRSHICKTLTPDFLEVVKRHPEIALKLMQALSERTSYYENKIASLARPARDQILDELKSMQQKRLNSLWGKLFHIPLQISHQKMAEKTGLNRVTVTKIFGELEREGSIKVDQKTREITILKP